MNSAELNKESLIQIELHIKSISKNTVRDEVINWFQQSPLHWLFILFVMKSYFLDEELSKQQLVEKINEHVVQEGKKTITTEFRYIDDAISKGFIHSTTSPNDARKKTISPTDRTITSINNWFSNFSADFAALNKANQ
tara:strand:+ start:192 stop:605 length:414 start_codon:yes stop_codon:yes gene_type:complete